MTENTQPDDMDVEGHRRAMLSEDDDDVEGHRRAMLAEDDDDVEGHVQPPRDLDIDR